MLEMNGLGRKKRKNQNFLMHCNNQGVPGAFLDEYGGTNISVVGSAGQVGNLKKFGTGCGFFNRGLLHLSNPLLLEGDYTLDMWVYVESLPTNTQMVMACKAHPDNSQHWPLALYPVSGSLYTRFNLLDYNVTTIGSILVPLKQWVHIASVRQGNTYFLFVNGKIAATTVGLLGRITIDHLFGWFERVMEYSMAGFADEVRVLDGTAAWTAQFTPPTSPYTV